LQARRFQAGQSGFPQLIPASTTRSTKSHETNPSSCVSWIVLTGEEISKSGRYLSLTLLSELDIFRTAGTNETMRARHIKDEARRLIEALPDDSTWEDLMYQICVRETIEAGLADCDAGRVTDVEKVREEFGLPA
jgi:predicted transcriptional regulator